MYRRRFLRSAGAAGGAAATVGLAGCAGVGGELDFDVGMLASAYQPREITVSVGDTVVWENTSARSHTVTATAGGIPDDAEFFASGGFDDYETALSAWQSDFGGRMENGDRFEHTFTVSGAYEYVCIPHREGGMFGTVVVEE
ncbi:plastocyanin/azurin family copper-binding protein [Halorubrum distributum]|uniref:Blue (Type 1) copper domain protein n=2 Tax=Halorubrum distributum TaxID=29283 RepID=M0DGN2_9EURY|nr:plastocyanin/azurin family copper-binding protein [Halorubrum terrestre]ELZ34615.1 blue (type 1) copper domain protein [Halorubrum terrestre JCM 10247]MYL66276.1 halocyanin [Halorubrum terrestre]